MHRRLCDIEFLQSGNLNIRNHGDITGKMWFGVGQGMKAKVPYTTVY
jgi:hypothetical protein